MDRKKIHVCFFSLDAYPYFNPQSHTKLGGAEFQMYIFATELAKDQKYKVCGIVDKTKTQKTETVENVTLHNFPVSSKKFKYLKIFFHFFSFFKLYTKINADVYIQRGASHWTGIISLFCRLKQKKFVYMAAHDGDTNRLLHPRRKGLVRKLMWWVYEYGLKRADLIIVQNELQKRELMKNYNKTSVVRLSAHRIPNEISKNQKKNILWVGRAKEWKRPDIFISLAKKFPKEHFCMAMPSFEKTSRKIKNVTTEAQRLPNMTFYEFVQPNKMDELFSRAKIYVLTSTSEGFPNTLIQASKNGTPILSYCIDPDSMLERYGIGLNAHKNEQTLIKQLEQLINNEVKWEQMSRNAHSYAKAHHDIKRIIEKDKNLLQTVLY